jgi:single-strand DNA-binding protein
MEITGRLTANAEVRTVKGDKKVTGFTIAMNRSYRKDGEKVTVTTYVDCSYWINAGIADFLKKGTLVQLYGDMDVSAWIDKEGKAQGRLTFHIQTVKILAQSGNSDAGKSSSQNDDKDKAGTVKTRAKAKATAGGAPEEDDMPF